MSQAQSMQALMPSSGGKRRKVVENNGMMPPNALPNNNNNKYGLPSSYYGQSSQQLPYGHPGAYYSQQPPPPPQQGYPPHHMRNPQWQQQQQQQQQQQPPQTSPQTQPPQSYNGGPPSHWKQQQQQQQRGSFRGQAPPATPDRYMHSNRHVSPGRNRGINNNSNNNNGTNQQSPPSGNNAWGGQSPWRQQPPQPPHPPSISKHSNYNSQWGNNGGNSNNNGPAREIANNKGYNLNTKDRGIDPLRPDNNNNRPSMMKMDSGNPHQPVYCIPEGANIHDKNVKMGMNMMMMNNPRINKGDSNNSTIDDKGRGSYRCGKCGAPKKGHVCPYQPKLKRRSGEPPPETRNASTQVELDEFLVLRRLNLEIQGYPESYATVPDMVGAEVAPLSPDKSIVDKSPSQSQRSNTPQGQQQSTKNNNSNTPDNPGRGDVIGVTPPR